MTNIRNVVFRISLTGQLDSPSQRKAVHIKVWPIVENIEKHPHAEFYEDGYNFRFSEEISGEKMDKIVKILSED
jgi:hypothetical protein